MASVGVFICADSREPGLLYRVIERKEGEELAKSLNCAFTEASAKDNENVARIFELMVGEVEKCASSKMLFLFGIHD